MRTRAEIMKGILFNGNYESVTIEVLLDIRDLLQRKQGDKP